MLIAFAVWNSDNYPKDFLAQREFLQMGLIFVDRMKLRRKLNVGKYAARGSFYTLIFLNELIQHLT